MMCEFPNATNHIKSPVIILMPPKHLQVSCIIDTYWEFYAFLQYFYTVKTDASIMDLPDSRPVGHKAFIT